jgi:hypothetical protein
MARNTARAQEGGQAEHHHVADVEVGGVEGVGHGQQQQVDRDDLVDRPVEGLGAAQGPDDAVDEQRQPLGDQLAGSEDEHVLAERSAGDVVGDGSQAVDRASRGTTTGGLDVTGRGCRADQRRRRRRSAPGERPAGEQASGCHG